ncbi:hypothetical protein [Comamonas sp. CMM02]|uniref:hypothetical protein n=1 Tax=Comamonas sp. CMM02 TaxID=2769307 RepID=UPI00177B7C16|nr:hypothetical protein [Comamonas sp. CMM02]
MSEHKLNHVFFSLLLRGCLFFGAAVLLVWQFITFMDVVQMHTARAQNVSRSASWSNQPVGTMPQASHEQEQATQHE